MARIYLTDYWIEIVAPATDPDFIDLLSNVQNIHKTLKRDTYRCSLRLLPDVLKYLRRIDSADQLPDGPAKTALLKEQERVVATRELKAHGTTVEYPGLWGHQNLGVALAEINHRYNFFYETRTGKTRMAYQIMQNALSSGRVKRCVVFAPTTIIKSWLKDAEAFPQLRVAAFYGDDKQKEKALHTPCHVMLWSEGMIHSYLQTIKAAKFDMCFFDESSKIKNYRSQISKDMLALSTTIPYWYNLSATPAPNGKHEYYVQMLTVDPYAFNPARTHFVTKFFDDFSRNRNYENLRIKPNMEEEFMQIIEDRSIYVDQSVMPTAQKIWHTYPFQLSTDVFKAYDEMRQELASSAVESVIITAESQAAMRAKLQQITSGFLLDTDAIKENKIHKRLGDPATQQTIYELGYKDRVAALRRLLEQEIGLEEQCVIWAHYEQEFIDIATLLSFMAFPYHNNYVQTFCVLRGGTSIQEKEDAIASFKAHKTQYLICHPLSVGMGINLTEAHHAIYYRVTDSWEALKQSSERIFGHITVQPNDCHYWVLLAQSPEGADTVDKLVYNNVSNKQDASTGFLDYLKAGVLNDCSGAT